MDGLVDIVRAKASEYPVECQAEALGLRLIGSLAMHAGV